MKRKSIDSAFLNSRNADNIYDGVDATIKALNRKSIISFGASGTNSSYVILWITQDKHKEKGFPTREI